MLSPRLKRLILSSKLARAKERYATDRYDAFRIAALNLQPYLGVDFHISSWTTKAAAAFGEQWSRHKRTVNWDWPEIMRRHNDPDRLDLAIWVGDLLCGLGLGTTTAQAVKIRFCEGSPFPECPLKGRRILVMLEAATCYAQARGKQEIRIAPKNSSLESLYRDIYGFELVKGQNQEPYYRKGV